eukprot:Sdes_comp18603_c0_seq4m8757
MKLSTMISRAQFPIWLSLVAALIARRRKDIFPSIVTTTFCACTIVARCRPKQSCTRCTSSKATKTKTGPSEALFTAVLNVSRSHFSLPTLSSSFNLLSTKSPHSDINRTLRNPTVDDGIDSLESPTREGRQRSDTNDETEQPSSIASSLLVATGSADYKTYIYDVGPFSSPLVSFSVLLFSSLFLLISFSTGSSFGGAYRSRLCC